MKITSTTVKSNEKSAAVSSSPNVIRPVHSSHSHRSRYGGVAVERPGPDVVEDHEDPSRTSDAIQIG